MALAIPKGDAFIPGRGRDAAVAALAAAEAAGLDPTVVRTVQGGYLVPEAVVEHYSGPAKTKSIQLAEADADASDDDEGGDDQSSGDDDSGAPAKSAAKPEWVAFAVSSGLSEEEALALTKDQLVERFGSGK